MVAEYSNNLCKNFSAWLKVCENYSRKNDPKHYGAWKMKLSLNIQFLQTQSYMHALARKILFAL